MNNSAPGPKILWAKKNGEGNSRTREANRIASFKAKQLTATNAADETLRNNPDVLEYQAQIVMFRGMRKTVNVPRFKNGAPQPSAGSGDGVSLPSRDENGDTQMRDVGAGSAPTQSGTDSPIPLASALGDAAATFDIPPSLVIPPFSQRNEALNRNDVRLSASVPSNPSDPSNNELVESLLTAVRKLLERTEFLENSVSVTLRKFHEIQKHAATRPPSADIQADIAELPNKARRCKDRDELLLQAIARDYLNKLLNRDVARGVDLPPLPHPPVNPTILPANLENFTMAWNLPESHAYNLSAAVLVATFIISDPRYESQKFNPSHVGKLAECVLTRFTSLRKTWKDQTRTSNEDRDFNKHRNRVRVSQNRLLGYRKEAVKATPGIARFIPFMESLSSDCMSGDEDADVGGRPVYWIVEKPWRSPEFTNFLRKLDWLYNTRPRVSQGGRVRIREVPPQDMMMVCQMPAPRNLPAVCYDQDWLKSLNEYQLATLSVDFDTSIEFKLPDMIESAIEEGSHPTWA